MSKIGSEELLPELPPTDFRGPSAIFLGMGGFVLIVIGLLVQTNWKANAWLGNGIAIFGGVLCTTHILYCVLYSYIRKRRAKLTLRKRKQLDAEAFGLLYFPESTERAQIAAQVRDALSDYLKLNLDGLQPEDPLDVILDTRTDDPSLLWHLEDVFQLGQTFEKPEEFEVIHRSIVTFKDLVEFVDSRLQGK